MAIKNDPTQPQFRPLTFKGGVAEYDAGRFGTITVPKSPVENLRYRQSILREAEDNDDLQASIRHVCKESCLFWINTFAWTFAPLKITQSGRIVSAMGGEGTDLPFITWPVQDEIVKELIYSITNGRDAAIDKSRDMGLSWLILTVFQWFIQFQRDMHFTEVSRKLALVDEPADPDSLFWKHDYLIRKQPPWLVPTFRRWSKPQPKLANLDMGGTITGQATTGDVGHGGRRHAMLFDEAARMRSLKTIWEGAASTTGCRIANSTAHGPGFFSKLVRSRQVFTLRAMWWDHPVKGRGRELVADGDGKVRVTSPFYRAQKLRAVSRREIAENLDADHYGAGYTVFDSDVISRQLLIYAQRPPVYVGDLRFATGSGIYADRDQEIRDRKVKSFRFRESDKGLWRFWCSLHKSGGQYRPRQDTTYVMGADVAGGTGASNSVISVVDAETGWKVAEWCDNETSPDELARIMCMAGLWFGGQKRCAFMAWEANGYGNILGKFVLRLGYPWFYRQLVNDGKERGTKRTKKPGWWSSAQSKQDVIEDYRAALAQDRFKNPSPEALEEALEYIFYENGGIGPGELQGEDAAAQKTHGDRVIADAVARHALLWAGRMSLKAPPPPPNSPGERRLRRKSADIRAKERADMLEW